MPFDNNEAGIGRLYMKKLRKDKRILFEILIDNNMIWC